MKSRERFKELIKNWTNGRTSSEVWKIVGEVLESIPKSASEDQPKIVQQVYRNVGRQLLPLKISEAVEKNVLEATEQIVCDSCYHRLFFHDHIEQQEMIDLSLQDRIRSLRWICPSLLDVRLDFRDSEVFGKIDSAVLQLLAIDSERTPSGKLRLVVLASNLILDALRTSSPSGRRASADEFLPALIYTLLQANPPMLQSNLDFLQRFSPPGTLISGESAYFFTSLVSAAAFIQELSGDSLGIDNLDFASFVAQQLPAGFFDSPESPGYPTLKASAEDQVFEGLFASVRKESGEEGLLPLLSAIAFSEPPPREQMFE